MWSKTEPLRLYIYSLLAPLAAVLVLYGVVDGNAVPLLIALATAVLGVAGTEAARAKVASPQTQENLRHGAVDTLRQAGYTVVEP